MHAADFASPAVARLREDLALALRAAAFHGLAEGVCNHFSVALPDGSTASSSIRAGCTGARSAPTTSCWSTRRHRLAGRHPVEPTAMFIHAAVHRIAGKAWCCTPTCPMRPRSRSPPTARSIPLSQNAMRFHGRIAIDPSYNGLALDSAEGERIARAMRGEDVAFLGNHGVIVCGARRPTPTTTCTTWSACACTRCWRSTGRPLARVNDALAARVRGRSRASASSRTCTSRRCGGCSPDVRARRPGAAGCGQRRALRVRQRGRPAERVRRRQGPPLLLVHSVNAAASAAEVRPLHEHYRATRTVLSLDLPGYGFSDRSDRATRRA